MKFFVKNSSLKSQKIRWPQNSDEMFQEFRSEFWRPTSVSNHSITGFNTIVSNKIELKGKTRILIRIQISYYAVIWNLEILWNSLMILIRILMGSFRGKFIRWRSNSSKISIRILAWKCSCLFFDQNSNQKQICNFNVSWFYVFLIEFENDRIWHNC